MNNFVSTLRLLSEGKSKFEPTDDEILDIEEDHNLRCGKKFIAKALSIQKQFSKEYKVDDVVKWCKANGGKGQIPDDVDYFLSKQKWDREDAAMRKRWDREDAAANKKPKGMMTDKQFEKMCKDAAKDWQADNDHDKSLGGHDTSLGDVALDMADNMLYDPKVKEYVKYQLGDNYNAQTAREYVADSIHV